MTKSTEKLPKRIHNIKFDNQNLLTSYDRLADSVYLQVSNLCTIQIMFKDEMLSLREKTLDLGITCAE